MSRLSRNAVYSRAALAAVAAAYLAACSDAPTADPTGPRTSANVQELNSTRHVFHTKEWFAAQNGQNGARPQKGTGISYHGGTVLQNGTNVVAIYWGSSTRPVAYQNLPGAGAGAGSADGSLIGTFLSSFSSLVDVAAGKNYFNINHTYYGQTGAYITPTVTYTAYWNTNGDAGAPTPSSSPSDGDMVALIQWGLSNGRLSYDPNALYAIFTGNGVNLGGGFGVQYCAYHTHGSTSYGNVFYAAMPYNQQYPSGCTSGFGSPNGDVAANSEVNTLAHEIEETTTDDMGNAWYDNRGYENADKCAWTWGTTAAAPSGGTYNLSGGGYYFLVQRNWVNAGSGGCATGY